MPVEKWSGRTAAAGTDIRTQAGIVNSANAAATGGTSAAIAINGGSNNVELQFTTGIINSGAATVYKPMSVAAGSGSTTITFNEGGAFVNATLNISKAVILRTTGGGSQDGLMGQITGSGAGAGNDSVIFSAPSGTKLYYTSGYSGSGAIANTFAGNVRMTGGGNIDTQNVTYISNTAAYMNAAIPATASVTVDPGTTWSLSWGNQSIDGLNGSGPIVNNVSNNNTITVGASDGSGNYSGSISGGGGLIKTGSGTQVLSGTNSYSGGTVINNGVLQIGFANVLPTSESWHVTISGGTLDMHRLQRFGRNRKHGERRDCRRQPSVDSDRHGLCRAERHDRRLARRRVGLAHEDDRRHVASHRPKHLRRRDDHQRHRATWRRRGRPRRLAQYQRRDQQRRARLRHCRQPDRQLCH